MVVYEVNLTVNHQILKPYLEWILTHIKKMLRFKGFKNAYFLKDLDQSSEVQTLVVFYFIDSIENLNHYLTHHASKMRQEALDEFGDQFTASRRILDLINPISEPA